MDREIIKPHAAPLPSRKSGIRRLLNWKFLLVLIIGAVLLVIWSSPHGQAGPVSASTASNLMTVAVARVLREDLAQDQSFEAEFRPYQEIDLHAKVAGFVQSINVDIGDRVKKGDLLATLEIPELAEDLEKASALERRNAEEIKRAAAAYDEAHLMLGRISAINQTKPHLIAQQEIDAAQAKDQVAEATLAAARQDVEVSKAEVKKLKVMMDFCKITAPFSGVITKRYADEGALVQGGVTPSASAMPLVRLSQIHRLRLDFPASVSYISRIKEGDAVEIHVQGLAKSIAGTICRLTRKVDTATRTMEAEVDIANPDLSLIPGAYALATLKFDKREKVLTVPTEAVSRQKAVTVFVLNKQDEVEERPVVLGLETPEKLEIVSGLSENELVLVGSRSQIKPGQKVQPRLVALTELP
jgi:RND family efflux transporter MFP subunit